MFKGFKVKEQGMRKAVRFCRGRRGGKGSGIFAFYSLFLILTMVMASGCQEGAPVTLNWPDRVSVEELKPEAVRVISEALRDDSPLIRPKAIEVIAETKQMLFVPKVIRLLNDEYVEVRFLAAVAVGDLKYSLAEKEVRRLLEDEDRNVRIAAAYALNKLGYSEDFDTLRRAIASEDQTVRANAAFLLGKSGDKSVLKFLWWTMGREDSGAKARFNAAEAIAMLGDERIYEEKLWAMLISAYADDRVTGIRAMGGLGTVEAKNALITMLDDDVVEVRLAAAEQLGKLGDRSGEPEVLDIFTKNLTAGLDRADRERIYVRGALAIGQIGTKSLTRFLPFLLEHESKFVRIAAAKAVFRCTMGRGGE